MKIYWFSPASVAFETPESLRSIRAMRPGRSRLRSRSARLAVPWFCPPKSVRTHWSRPTRWLRKLGFPSRRSVWAGNNKCLVIISKLTFIIIIGNHKNIILMRFIYCISLPCVRIIVLLWTHYHGRIPLVFFIMSGRDMKSRSVKFSAGLAHALGPVFFWCHTPTPQPIFPTHHTCSVWWCLHCKTNARARFGGDAPALYLNVLRLRKPPCPAIFVIVCVCALVSVCMYIMLYWCVSYIYVCKHCMYSMQLVFDVQCLVNIPWKEKRKSNWTRTTCVCVGGLFWLRRVRGVRLEKWLSACVTKMAIGTHSFAQSSQSLIHLEQNLDFGVCKCPIVQSFTSLIKVG